MFSLCARVDVIMVEVLQNFIDGEFVSCDRHIDSYNPATGEVHLKIPDSDKDDVEKAVDAANKAFIKYIHENIFKCFKLFD